MNELNFYNNDVGLDTSNDVQTGGSKNNDSEYQWKECWTIT